MYHLAYFINPKSNKEKIEAEILKLIQDFGGEIVDKESAKLKSLAYPIKHFVDGFFGFINFKLNRSKIFEINAKLRLSQDLLRYSIFKQEFEKQIKKFKKPIKTKNHEKLISLPKKQPKFKIEELDKELDQILDESL